MRRKTAEMGPEARGRVRARDMGTVTHAARQGFRGTGSAQGEDIDGDVFGSVARGDVKPTSDVDIFIPVVVSSMQVAHGAGAFQHSRTNHRAGDPACAGQSPPDARGRYERDLSADSPRQIELEFYRFGGEMGLQDIKAGQRACGVDKRLMLIEPTPDGHVETPLSDLSSGCVAKKIGVGQAIVEERMRVLERRADVGRTGVYLERQLDARRGIRAGAERPDDRRPGDQAQSLDLTSRRIC